MKNDVCVIGCYKHGLKQSCEEHLDELDSLLYTCDLNSVHRFLCPLRQINAATFIGSGKIAEIKLFLEESGIKTIVFDDELLPSQQRNLEKALKVTVLDRCEVILNVFSLRARSKESKLQVELANIKYTIPRLKRMWTHLSRQRGGGVNQKGEGEAQIELDRRLLKHRETSLKKELELVKTQRQTRMVSKQRSSVFSFTIVGYTNAGKSTLMNLLTNASVLSEDKLFATLDTTTRKLKLPNNAQVILTDTVGFIRKLPHFLVSSFRSTLDESLHADCLIKLIDISNPAFSAHMGTVEEVLESLKCSNSAHILVFNKCDNVDEEIITSAKIIYPDAIFISVKSGTGIEDLLNIMTKMASNGNKHLSLQFRFDEYEYISLLHELGAVIEQQTSDDHIFVKAQIPNTKLHSFARFII